MNITGIISIGGMSGLYKVVASTKAGFIVESLADKKRMPAYSHYKISSLEDIRVFTTGEDILLSEVFKKIAEKENYAPAIDHKASDEEIKKYFAAAIPEHDAERVYLSDMRKIISWYNLLQKADLLKQAPETAENAEAISVNAEVEKKKLHKNVSKDTALKATKPNNMGGKKTIGVRKTGTA